MTIHTLSLICTGIVIGAVLVLMVAEWRRG